MTKQTILKDLVLFSSFILLSTNVYSQREKKPTSSRACKTNSKAADYTLHFDKNGEWIEGFPNMISSGKTLKWFTPDTLDNRMYNKLKNAFTAIDTLNTDSTIKNFLITHPQLFRVFQRDSTLRRNDTADAIGQFKIYTNGLTAYFTKLEVISNFKTAKDALDPKIDYFPGLDADRKKSFSINAKNQYGQDISDRTKDNTLDWNTETSTSFSVYRELKDNQVIAEHYKNNFPKYKKIDWVLAKQKEINYENKQLLQHTDGLMNEWEFFKRTGNQHKADSVFNILILKSDSLQIYIAETGKLQQYLIQENREWIKCWLWYTNWEPVLNPLDLTGFDSDNRMIELKTKIDSIRDKINYLTKFIENKNIQKFSSFDELKNASEQLASMNLAIRNDEKELGRLEKKKKGFQDGLSAIQVEKQLVHYGELYASNSKRWQPMRFHNYSRNMELAEAPNVKKHYWDGDAEKLIAANVPKGVNISLIDKIEPYTPKSFFSTILDPVLDNFYNVLNENLGELQAGAKLLNPFFATSDRKKKAEAELKSLEDSREGIKTSLTQIQRDNNGLNKSIENSYKQMQNEKIPQDAKQKIFDISRFNTFDLTDQSFKEKFTSYKNKIFSYYKAKKYDTVRISNLLNKMETDGILFMDNQRKQLELNYSLEQLKKEISRLNLNIEKMIREALSSSLKLKYDSIIFLKTWFSKQTPALQPYELKPENDTFFRSMAIGPIEEIGEGFKKNNYTIYKRKGSEKEEKVASWQYKRYSGTLFDPMAGPVFTSSGRSSLIYNPSLQTFTYEDIRSSDIILGLRIFPLRVWIEDNCFFGKLPTKENIKRGVSFVNRIAITGGVGVRQTPLKNYFAGFSYDVFTGLSINYGWNFYSKKDYTIKNGIVEKEFESFASTKYWGITIAPLTLLKIFKIINVKP